MDDFLFEFATPDSVQPEDVPTIVNLLAQLSTHSVSIGFDEIKQVASNSYLLFCRDHGRVVGCATLVPIYKPTGLAGHVEDVVVDEAYRGKGLGKELMHQLIDKARALNMKHLDLTSGPNRIAANQMYQHLGFGLRETNKYRLVL